MTKSQKAWVLVDFGNSAFASTILAAIFPVYFPSLLPKEGVNLAIGERLIHFDALTIWSYGVAASIFITVALSPLIGAWADRAGYKKKLFILFTCLGLAGTAGLFFSDTWIPALISFAIANVGFSASNVYYNSLLASVADEEEWNALSMKGFAWGYFGGGILLGINLLMILKFEWFGFTGKVQALQWAFLSVAVWWGVFSCPAMFLIEEKKSASEPSIGSVRNWLRIVFFTLKSLISEKAILFFIISFAFFNEGVQTVISMASIYGKEAVGLSESVLIGTLLMIQILGLPFTLLMNYFVSRIGARKVMTTVLLVWVGIISYAFLLKTGIQFLILGVLVSIVLGVSQALPRAIFQKMIPRGKEAEYFSFFALSGKMTSFLGPFTFGMVQQLYGNSRISLLTISLFFIVGLLLFRLVPLKGER